MRKEWYERHAITIPEQLAVQYAKMRKLEILLHQYILSIAADDGIIKRNMSAAARELRCSKPSLYDAETSLTIRGFLKTTRRNSTRFWKVSQLKALDYAESVDYAEAEEDSSPVVSLEEMIGDVEPKRRGFFSFLWRLKDEK